MRTLLLLATTTGYQTRSFGEAAQRMGLRVVFGTDRCGRLDDPWQDRALPLKFHKPDKALKTILEFARSEALHAIVAVGDLPTVAAAMAARELGLPWHTPAGAHACHNKFRARLAMTKAGLQAPAFACAPFRDGPDALIGAVPFPCVVKPAGLSASRGVIRADNAAEFEAAFKRLAALLASRDVQVKKDDSTELVIAEEYLPGDEYAVEAIMEHGCMRVLAVFDKPDPLEGPFFEETIYVTPSRLGAGARQTMAEALQRAAAAMGLFHGPVHAEFRVNERGPWLLDIAARPIGGLCSRALRFTGGAASPLSLEEIVIRNALGESLAGFERESLAAGVMMIPVPEGGVFEGVDGLEAAQAVPGVDEVIITARVHDKLVPWPEGSSYPGFIFARAATPEEVELALRDAHGRLRFRVSPALAVI